ncbi:MAG: type III-B CRISPR module RAMP protein Cmr6 [Acidobacteria bacterium]|nr:type III-B CRISPR module RAMP protein Cmr6 [Acidobacteriota bacterium]
MSSRRNALANIKTNGVQTANASLWLNKFLGEPNASDNDKKRKLIEGVINQKTISDTKDLYKEFFTRWEQTLKDYGVKETRKAQVRGRMVIGLGSESVLETSVTLHHTYGVPYIPGSALKGLARSFTKKMDGWTDEHSEIVFGNKKENDNKQDDNAFAGFITFFDALLIPNGQPFTKALHLDVLTVHHKEYYEDKPKPPADWDDPTPIPFLSATGTYLLALAGPTNWINPTLKLLELALKEEGIGAKTSSGYGRMEFKG